MNKVKRNIKLVLNIIKNRTIVKFCNITNFIATIIARILFNEIPIYLEIGTCASQIIPC